MIKEAIVENSSSITKYKVNSRQKVRNILVDCNYFENKGNISFLVTIKLFGKHPYKPIYHFEMYGNTQNPKYNHISRHTKDYDAIPLAEGFEGYDTFERVLAIINSEFDTYTTNFISCAKNLIDGKGTITKTPQFIKDIIDEVRDVRLKGD